MTTVCVKPGTKFITRISCVTLTEYADEIRQQQHEDFFFFFFLQGSPQPGAQKVWQKNKKKGKKAKPQKQQPKKKPVKQQPKKKNSQEEKEVSLFEK